MRKHELVYLHALCVEIRRYLEAHGEVPAGAFAAYDAFGISPVMVNRPKADHEAALWRLLAGIRTTLAAWQSAAAERPPHPAR